MGTLYIVATPIGNLGDITIRALEILKTVDIILCEDTRTSSHLLTSLNIKTKLISYHKFNETTRSDEVINLLKNKKNIALITDAGTPCISDPGSIVVDKALENNFPVYSIPGPSALITALTLTGLKVDNFAFYGFLERKKSQQLNQLQKINNNDIKFFIFYESPKRIINTLQNIQEVMNNPKLIILNDLTKKFEKRYSGLTNIVIQELLNNPNYEKGEYVIIVKKNILDNNLKADNISLEALLIDKIIKEKCTMKEAISALTLENKNYSKKAFYSASLNIKNIFKN